ncbi:MAG: ethanolamine utilization protein EutH [Clostridia bacterium]|nr:ethanolamine utilization protein EutH [Clostridia bacterium]
MNFVSYIMVVFSVIAAIDRIFGSRLGLGKEFDKGFMLLGTMMLSMTGMIVISPLLADLLRPVFDFVYNTFGIDPSVIPAAFFANDMGGAPLCVEVAKDVEVGKFNALVVSSMMGATVSFTIPFALGIVKNNVKELMVGILCGIVTVPIGCFVSGLMLSIPLKTLIINVLPLVIFSVIIALGLLLIPDICVKIFKGIAFFIKALITIGLALGILRFLIGVELVKGLETIENGAMVCVNASIVMSGAFPFMYIISRLLDKPLSAFATRVGINKTSAVGLVSNLATNATTFQMMNDMDSKGAMVNSAFAVSAAFTFAGHLAFTMAFDDAYILYVIVGKLLSGVCSLIIAFPLYNRIFKKNNATA